MLKNKPMSNAALKKAGLACLSANFGKVEAERIIFLFKRDPFDYTQWRKSWMEDATVDDIFEMAEELEKDEEI